MRMGIGRRIQYGKGSIVKQKLTALIVVLLLAAIVVTGADKTTTEIAIDTLVTKITGDYDEALSKADKAYKKDAAPLVKRYEAIRRKKILLAGKTALRRLISAKGGLSELNRVKMDQAIAKISASLKKQIGDVRKNVPRAAVMKVCSVSFKGRIYLAVNSNVNWEEADALCKKMGGHLAYIETPQELFFLAKVSRARVWVGAKEVQKEGDWRWGNGKPVGKDFWCKTEPNNGGGRESHAMLEFWNGARMLCDIPLNYAGVTGFICEWE